MTSDLARHLHMWNVPASWLFYLLAALAIAVFAVGLYARVRMWLTSPRRPALPEVGRGLGNFLRDGLLGARIFRGDLAAGIMHLMILWGFLGLFLGTVLLAADEYLGNFLKGGAYLAYSLVLELCGLMLVAGIVWALVRRYLQQVPRLERTPADLLAPAWLLVIGLTGFLLEGARLAATRPAWAGWSFAGGWVSALFASPPAAEAAYPWLWWLHALLSLGLIAWLPYGKLMHALAAPASLWVQDAPLEAPPRQAVDEEAEPAEEHPAADHAPAADEFALRQMLHLDACTRCGRCAEVCPATGAGEPLSPRDFLQRTRRYAELKYSPLNALPWLQARHKQDLVDETTIVPEHAWYCTTCRACLEVCPVQAAPIEIIRQVRGSLVESGVAVPDHLAQTLERLYKYGNPWLAKKGQKAAWQGDLDIPDLSKKGEADLLYFVGCTTSLDTRAQGLARALSSVLAHCGVSFGTLGKKEPCCGDIARRTGEEGLFEDQRDDTLALLEKQGLNRLVTSSPHCYDTLKKAYPATWPDDEGGPATPFLPQHYSQLLARLLDEGKLKFNNKLDLTVTYHDPCYLSRHNGVVAEPRRVIQAIPGVKLVEMADHGRLSLCCGGGGGRMWQELPEQGALAQRRLEQAAASGASVVITACPLCLIMLEDAKKTGGYEDRLSIMDLNELCALGLGLSEAPDADELSPDKEG